MLERGRDAELRRTWLRMESRWKPNFCVRSRKMSSISLRDCQHTEG